MTGWLVPVLYLLTRHADGPATRVIGPVRLDPRDWPVYLSAAITALYCTVSHCYCRRERAARLRALMVRRAKAPINWNN
jgi:hypothetical protein